MLNIAQKILLKLEDRKSAKIDDFNFAEPRKVRGAIGRLEAAKMIERNPNNRKIFYLTKSGEKFIDNTLSLLKKTLGRWDGKWRIITFDIPENQRSKRAALRYRLAILGMKQLQASLWISPHNLIPEISKLIEELDISDNINIFTAQTETKKDINKLWDLNQVNNDYLAFISQADSLISRKPNSFEAKKLIFDYALILKKDPQLPEEFLPANWPATKAKDQYKKLRQFCY